ncbi:MAG: hypothetical protein JWO13_837 [Acidobacteriales bacterium]|nr:hypothetical protein [Terriglobales bacterium]
MNAGTARALEPENKEQSSDLMAMLRSIGKNLIAAAVIAGFTWFVAVNRVSAVQDNRITAVEKALETKASKESVDSIKEQLNKMDNKIDKLLDQRK